MYELFYDEFTKTFFVGELNLVELRLAKLRRKVWKTNRLLVNDYCKTLGIREVDPTGKQEINLWNYDIRFMFQLDYGYCDNGAVAFKVVLEG